MISQRKCSSYQAHSPDWRQLLFVSSDKAKPWRP